jgi:hypothetical protein
MRANQFIKEAAIGTHPKRPARTGSRPDRGHKAEPRYAEVKPPKSYDPDWISKLSVDELNSIAGKRYDKPETNEDILDEIARMEEELEESGKASRGLCTSSRPDKELGASNLASCKSQGLRARDGEKSHLIGHGGSSVRITVGGKKIKGKKYGGPLPDYGTRKGQI